MKLSNLGEFALIESLARQFERVLPQGIQSIGDDAAVIPLSHFTGDSKGDLLVTSDLMVEDRHFRRGNFNPYSLGWKLLSVNISDIAAMGGKPCFGLITLQLSNAVNVEWVSQLYSGIEFLAAREGVHIVGGDTSSGNEISLGLTLIGYSRSRPILRSGAQVGDKVWISGELGSARLGFELSEGKANWIDSMSEIEIDKIKKAFYEPEPRSEIGGLLAEGNLATSMIDVSDGLIQDASHLARKSKITIELDLQSLPCLGVYPDKRHALTGGEDYQLLFTAPDTFSDQIVALGAKHIGRVVEEKNGSLVEISLSKDKPVLSAEEYLNSIGFRDHAGFQHF